MANGSKLASAKKKARIDTMAESSSGIKEILQTSLNDGDEKRQGGDGESLPQTPPNETHVEHFQKPSDSPFLINIRVDAMAVILFAIGLATRLYRIDQPKNVV